MSKKDVAVINNLRSRGIVKTFTLDGRSFSVGFDPTRCQYFPNISGHTGKLFGTWQEVRDWARDHHIPEFLSFPRIPFVAHVVDLNMTYVNVSGFVGELGFDRETGTIMTGFITGNIEDLYTIYDQITFNRDMFFLDGEHVDGIRLVEASMFNTYWYNDGTNRDRMLDVLMAQYEDHKQGLDSDETFEMRNMFGVQQWSATNRARYIRMDRLRNQEQIDHVVEITNQFKRLVETSLVPSLLKGTFGEPHQQLVEGVE